ncbi:MAG: hypothetical protein FWD68_01015 [Alphaproteobacteria bacterium]|nr:hypothetical protein [Alphaproteobacteria bacterium]
MNLPHSKGEGIPLDCGMRQHSCIGHDFAAAMSPLTAVIRFLKKLGDLRSDENPKMAGDLLRQ